VTEQLRRQGRRGKRLRPFCRQAQVQTRGCATLWQRVRTDFGAETSFGQIPARVREHYGIEWSASSARMVTRRHAHQAGALAPTADPRAATLIPETDGRMIPIVENAPPVTASPAAAAPPLDRRRPKKLCTPSMGVN